jgi:hypothetical protein
MGKPLKVHFSPKKRGQERSQVIVFAMVKTMESWWWGMMGVSSGIMRSVWWRWKGIQVRVKNLSARCFPSVRVKKKSCKLTRTLKEKKKRVKKKAKGGGERIKDISLFLSPSGMVRTPWKWWDIAFRHRKHVSLRDFLITQTVSNEENAKWSKK